MMLTDGKNKDALDFAHKTWKELENQFPQYIPTAPQIVHNMRYFLCGTIGHLEDGE